MLSPNLASCLHRARRFALRVSPSWCGKAQPTALCSDVFPARSAPKRALVGAMSLAIGVAAMGCNDSDPVASGTQSEGGATVQTGTEAGATGGSSTQDPAEQAPIPDFCANQPNGTACDANQRVCVSGACVAHRCGDGIKGPGEQCDDGNLSDGDGCQRDCRLPSQCGNGVLEPGEACDAGAQNGVSGSTCSAQCQLQQVAVCGNGKREAGEECDDGNRVGRDGCSSLCMHERCGNGIVDANEECDDGNRKNHDGCSSYCYKERCGDGVLHASQGERCDDGNAEPGDGCDAECQLESRCGDGKLEPPGEICDDGNQVDGDGCSADCKLEAGYCGDGIAQSMEECDDGNLVNEDGCSDVCTYEVQEKPACKEVDSEPLPARSRVVNKVAPRAQFIYTTQLFDSYRSLCGGCHVDSNQGDFQTRGGTMTFVAAEFEGKREQILDSMHTELAHAIMPPKAKPLSELPDSAPTVVLASQLAAWYDQGLSPDGFYWEGVALPAHQGYAVDEALSQKLTNIGSCEPTKELLHRNQHQSQRMDAYFSKATRWPELLSQTDFISMDSDALAQVGVLSYATTYELWADNAKKMRHFKLPYGKKIRYDAERQLFLLPENTRVYKTFLKEVKDHEGNKRYRKMETRVILVRNDEIQEDKSAKVRALFGSYRWNEEETEAVLINTPLRNGEPFADDIFIYDVNEARAEEIRRDLPASATFFDALLRGREQLVRHYAIPGSQRCIECHQGSLEENFVVGFSPLQLNRRPAGVGGVIEDKVYPSELGQLERFVKWDLFENLSDLGSIKPLEAAQSPSYWSGPDAISPDQANENKVHNAEHPDQAPRPELAQLSGPRTHRNAHELEMQGYMLGNCAHCHNPRGFPSLRAPALAERLNFHPLAAGGGIYGFRLDTMSPRNERGGDKRIAIPYITPSIYDVAETSTDAKQSVADLGFADAKLVAPWRSLIYRNVDTPYTYVFHETVYPHMPVHTPGYDCRIRDLTASWMLSIPSRMVGEPTDDPAAGVLDPELFPRGDLLAPQPWEEVYASEEDYAQASEAAQRRVEAFLAGQRSTRVCRDRAANSSKDSDNAKKGLSLEGSNIVSTFVLQGLRTEPYPSANGLPEEAHYNPYDMTSVPPPWVPRRADWVTALIEGEVSKDASDGERLFLDEILSSLRLDDEIKKFALTPIPLGHWQVKPECSFEKDKGIKDLKPEERWHWMEGQDEASQSLPLYYEAPGATIFKAVCAQCHGREGDSKGLMANLLNELTGGQSRVADFKTGLFGPTEEPGKFLKNVFSSEAKAAGMDVEDLAAQYMTWMSLGGTRSRIHSAVLSLVNATRTLGETRKGVGASQDANMLNVAKEICGSFLSLGNGKRPLLFDIRDFRLPAVAPTAGEDHDYKTMPLIGSIADAQTWLKICTMNNPMPIRIVAPHIDTRQSQPLEYLPDWLENYDLSGTQVKEKLSPKGAHFMASTRAGFVERSKGVGIDVLSYDAFGTNPRIEKMTANTKSPICVRYPPTRFFDDVQEKMERVMLDGKAIPYCPESWVPRDRPFGMAESEKQEGFEHMMTKRQLERWAMRGAANAGLMLYAFSKALITGETKLQVDYNFCEARESGK